MKQLKQLYNRVTRLPELPIRPVPRSKYKWWRKGSDGWELILMGEPDCFAYVIRYWNRARHTSAWCWILYMPRGPLNETARGWASAPHTAKRQVEAAIEEHWR